MVEYGVLVSKSADFLFDVWWQLRDAWYSIPSWILIVAVVGFSLLIYFTLRSR